jgi:hypothetical protein
MFHYVRGVPFDFNAGAYDNLNMWEQIDNGAQYTPTKKFLLIVPIALFLVSTHYTHYDLTYFIINTMATVAVIIPKLPAVSLPESSVSLSLTSRTGPQDTNWVIFWAARRFQLMKRYHLRVRIPGTFWFSMHVF